jgi:superoxide reductase
MKRRDALKKLGILGVIAAGAPAMARAVEEKKFCDVYTKYSPLIHNRTKMHIKDPAHPTKGELKHTPEIKVGDKDANGYTLVEITVGSKGIIHPSTSTHWIDFIELYKDGELVDRVVFEPGKAMGYAAFRVKLDGAKTLRAVEGCNLHGIWENTITL